jgi:putative addiction module component (TIGR02574 family)
MRPFPGAVTVFGFHCGLAQYAGFIKGANHNMTTTLQEFETLSVPERVQIVEDLWDNIAQSNANLPVWQWQRDELARRKNRYLQNPDAGETWDQVKQSILQPE